jgi:hypothetical protein
MLKTFYGATDGGLTTNADEQACLFSSWHENTRKSYSRAPLKHILGYSLIPLFLITFRGVRLVLTELVGP